MIIQLDDKLRIFSDDHQWAIQKWSGDHYRGVTYWTTLPALLRELAGTGVDRVPDVLNVLAGLVSGFRAILGETPAPLPAPAPGLRWALGEDATFISLKDDGWLIEADPRQFIVRRRGRGVSWHRTLGGALLALLELRIRRIDSAVPETIIGRARDIHDDCLSVIEDLERRLPQPVEQVSGKEG